MNNKNVALINELKELGLNMTYKAPNVVDNVKDGENSIEGKVFVLTLAE